MPSLVAQDSLKTIIAKNGDGIFSVLRKEGIDVVKYYENFIKLNKDRLKDGSRLVVGTEYLLPEAPDSFKNMGSFIALPAGDESPIFDVDLESFKKNDSLLQNTVYYLVSNQMVQAPTDSEKGAGGTEEELAKLIARKLLLSGARVYVFRDSLGNSLELNELVSIINKRFLMHHGKYQRLLIIKSQEAPGPAELEATIYHEEGSKDGQRLSQSMIKTLGKKNVSIKSAAAFSSVFTDTQNILFAKNMLPSLIYMEFGRRLSNSPTLRVTSNKKNLADLIANGILTDYSKLDFQDND
jgi:N-acetylmuramoyl-L-alanine amidase